MDKWNKKLDENKSKLEKSKSVVKEVKESYSDLTKGVNTLNNTNISLNDEDYAKFIRLNNELAEQFPELRTGIDEEGNAIIRLGDNAEESAKKLDELIERQEYANNLEIANNLKDTFANTKVLIDDSDKQIKAYENQIERYKNAQDSISEVLNGDFNQKVTTRNAEVAKAYIDALTKSGLYDQLSEAGFAGTYEVANGITETFIDFSKIKPEQKQKIVEALRTSFEDFEQFYIDESYRAENGIKTEQGKLQSNWSSLLMNNFIPSMHLEGYYRGLDDDGKAMADALVGGLTSETIEKIDSDNPGKYISENILRYFSELQDLGINVMDLFSGELSNEELINLYNQIQRFFDEKGVEVKLTIGEEAETTKGNLRNTINDILDKTGVARKDRTKEWDKISKLLSEKGIDSTEELNKLNSIVEGSKDESEMLDRINTHWMEINEIFANRQPIDFTTQLSSVQKLEEGLGQLKSIYVDIKDGGEFNWGNFLNNDSFSETFGNLTNVTNDYKDAYGEFIETISNSPNDIDKCQSAFNKLLTAYIDNSGALENVTGETMKATIAMLEQAGVVNAEEVVVDRVGYSYEEYTAAKNAAVNSGHTLDGILTKNVANLSDEEINAIYASEALQKVWMAENGLDGSSMDLSNAIAALEALGDKATEVQQKLLKTLQLAQIGQNLAGYDSIDDVNSGRSSKDKKESSPVLDGDFHPPGGGGAGSAGKEAGDAYVQAFEKEYNKLKELLDNGYIDQREYLEALKSLYQKYFRNRKEYLEQYAKYEKEYLQGKDYALNKLYRLKSGDGSDRGKTKLREKLKQKGGDWLGRQRTHDEYVEQLRNVNPNITVIGKYTKSNNKILHRCNIHNYEWEAFPLNMLRGCGCINCRTDASVKTNTKTNEEFISELNKINPNIKPIDKYINGRTPIKFECLICGNIWETQPRCFINEHHGCPECGIKKNSESRKFTTESYSKKLSENNPNIIIIDNYINSQTPVMHRCKICNHEWKAIPNGLLQGHGCPKCSDIKTSQRMLKSHEQFINDFTMLNSKSSIIKIKSKYSGAFDKIDCECVICGHTWNPTPDSLLHGSGCPKCSFSNGEYEISSILDTYNIEYYSQYSFDDLRGVNNGLLSYDFYLPKYNKLIEFHGRQHEESVSYFGGEERLKIQIEHDIRKETYAKEHGIELIVIWYDEFDDIEEILIKSLNLESVTTAVSA